MLRQHRPRILTPVNGKPASEHAFRWACQLARHFRAELRAIYVFEVPLEFPLESAQVRRDHQEGEGILTRVEDIANSERCRVNANLLEARNAGPAIVLEATERKMDLLVIGLPLERRSDARVMGVTADYVLKNAPCQVIISREPAATPPVAPASRG